MQNIKARIKTYITAFKNAYDSFENISRLQSKLYNVSEFLFVERLQPTKGYFREQVTDYVVPKDWGKTDPCEVTIYRNGGVDLWSDGIINLGTKEDVKTFSCPQFREDMPCTCDCVFRCKNNEWFDLIKKQIPEAKKQHALLVQKRKLAWQQMISDKTK